MSQSQSSEKHKNDSVNVMFRGVLPAHLVKDYVVCALEEVMPAQGRVLFHMSNDIKALSPRHSIAVKYWDRNLPSSVEICSLSGVAANASQVKRLLAQQAKHALDAEDFTVVNFGTESETGSKAAIKLAEMMGGAVVKNWKDENQYSLYWPDESLVKKHTVTKDSEIEALVMSNGWSRLDALALLCHVASQRATDGDVSLTVSSHAASGETVATLAWKESGAGFGGEYTLTGHDDIAISVNSGERDLLAQMALISGSASAYRFDNGDKVFHRFDVSGIEKQAIPSLDTMRSKVITASMPTRNLMILLPKGEGVQATEMLSEVIKSLSTADCSFVQSQKCNEKNAHTRTPSLDR